MIKSALTLFDFLDFCPTDSAADDAYEYETILPLD